MKKENHLWIIVAMASGAAVVIVWWITGQIKAAKAKAAAAQTASDQFMQSFSQ